MNWSKLPKPLGLSRYEVSKGGKIRNIHSNRILAPHSLHNDYITVCLRTDNNISKNYRLHILIAKTFLKDSKQDKCIVDHINRVKTDNRVENLRWVTPSESNKNQTRISKECVKVVQMDLKGNKIKTWKSASYAGDILGISPGCISRVCRGERKTTGGYKWEYLKPGPIHGEIWKKYGKIKVSNMGRVKKPNGHIYKGSKTSTGYLACVPGDNNKKKLVHVLVAELFIENSENYTDVNHKDEDKTNNVVTNLEWVTRSENVKHSMTKRSKALGKHVDQYDLDGNFIKRFESLREASKDLKINRTAISGVCHGHFKKTNNYIFKFVKEEDRTRKDHTCQKTRKIIAVDQEGKERVFESTSQATNVLKLTPQNIRLCCRGKIKTTGGYKFRYG